MRNSCSGSIIRLLVSEFGTGRAGLTAILVGKMLGVYRYRHRTEPWNHLGWKTPFKSLSQNVKISIPALDLRGGAAQTLSVCSGSGLHAQLKWKVWAASPATFHP